MSLKKETFKVYHQRMNFLVIALGLVLLVDPIFGYYNLPDEFFIHTNGVGGDCVRHRSCDEVRNSECSRGKCKCLPNYEPSKLWGESICKGQINAICESDDDCLNPDQVSCIFNRCQNYSKFLESGAEVNLYRAAALGSRCENNEHCSNHHNTTCVSGKCECDDGLGQDPFGICIPLDRRFCKYHEACWTDRVYCLGDYCLLPEEFFVESNAENVTNYAALHLDYPCQTDHHCRNLRNSNCQTGKCKCKEGYEVEGTSCGWISRWMISRTNEATLAAFERSLQSCVSDSECGDKPNLHCYQGKCSCSKGFKLQDNQCQEITPTTCSIDNDCPQGTRCFLNACRYLNEFFDSDDADKYAARDWQSICFNDHHCRNLNNTVCFENQCVCKSVYRFDLYNEKCVARPVSSCDNDFWCRSAGDDEQCVLGFCKLKSDLYLNLAGIDLDLYVALDHEHFCVNDHHCRKLNNSRCHNGACECIPEYEVVYDTCQKVMGVNCTSDLDCLMPGSHCIFNTCMMVQDFLALPSNKISTYATKRVDGFCQNNYHCRNLSGSICVKSKCRQKPMD